MIRAVSLFALALSACALSMRADWDDGGISLDGSVVSLDGGNCSAIPDSSPPDASLDSDAATDAAPDAGPDAPSGRPLRLAKIGDSNTSTSLSFSCLATSLAPAPLEATRHAFAADFGRVSTAALGGATCVSLFPATTDGELAATSAGYAVVLLGTNDASMLTYGVSATRVCLDYLVTTALSRGVLPILTTVHARKDNASANTAIDQINVQIRAIATARSVPLVDLAAELDGGGVGPDNIHLSASPAGACDFSDAGLAYGQNLRNLRTLEALADAARL